MQPLTVRHGSASEAAGLVHGEVWACRLGLSRCREPLNDHCCRIYTYTCSALRVIPGRCTARIHRSLTALSRGACCLHGACIWMSMRKVAPKGMLVPVQSDTVHVTTCRCGCRVMVASARSKAMAAAGAHMRGEQLPRRQWGHACVRVARLDNAAAHCKLHAFRAI